MFFITEQEAQEAKERAKLARYLAGGKTPYTPIACDTVLKAREELSRQFANVHAGRPDTYNKAAWGYINAKCKEALQEYSLNELLLFICNEIANDEIG